MYELEYSKNFEGARAVAVENGAPVTTGVNNFGTQYTYSKGDYAYCTGYYCYDGDRTFYIQTTTGLYIVAVSGRSAWEFTYNAIKLKTYTQTQAQYLVNKIIRNNIQITQNNLVCSRYTSKFSKEQLRKIVELQNRVVARDNALKEQGLCSSVQTSYPTGYAELSDYLDRLMRTEGIGIATWAVVVIAATVIAATATAAYFAYQAFADESEQDIKYSKELMAVLAEKLTPEEYEQLKNETKGIVTKARIKQAIGSYGKVLVAIGAAIGGALLFRFIKSRM